MVRKSSSGSRWVMVTIALFLVLLAGGAAAQAFHGTFTTMGTGGPIDLTLVRSGLALSGTIEGNGNSFALSGEVLADDETISFGTVEAPGGQLIFEAYLDESVLELYLFTPLANDEVQLESVTVFELETPTVSASAAPGAGQGSANPLANAHNADPFAGRYTDGTLTLELRATNTGYEGSIRVGGAAYPLTGLAAGDGIKGTFSVGAANYPFAFQRDGQGFILESEGTRYQLSAVANPLVDPSADPLVDPLADPSTDPPATPASPQQTSENQSPAEILATGPFGSFTYDAALAYIEALEFALGQVGRAEVLAGAGQQQIVDTLAANYSALDPESQLAMTNARQIWTETQAGWSIASAAERQQFVLDVLTIAYGEQAARDALGLGSGGGTPAGGGYLGMPSADGQLQQDTFNSQGCSASAGCDGYDPIGDDFSFDSPGDY